MKKNLLFVSVIVLGACALAFGQAATPAASAPAGAVKPAVPSGPPPTKIAIINIQQAIVNTEEGKKEAAALQVKFNPRKSALEKRQNDIIALQDQLKKGGSTMSDAAKDKIMRDIDSNTKALNRDGDDLNADVEKDTNDIMQSLGNKMMAILDTYAAQNGYAVILDVSNQQNPVFWAHPSTFITADIVKLYDQQHPVAGAAKAAPKPPAPGAAAPKPASPPPAAKKQ